MNSNILAGTGHGLCAAGLVLALHAAPAWAQTSVQAPPDQPTVVQPGTTRPPATAAPVVSGDQVTYFHHGDGLFVGPRMQPVNQGHTFAAPVFTASGWSAQRLNPGETGRPWYYDPNTGQPVMGEAPVFIRSSVGGAWRPFGPPPQPTATSNSTVRVQQPPASGSTTVRMSQPVNPPTTTRSRPPAPVALRYGSPIVGAAQLLAVVLDHVITYQEIEQRATAMAQWRDTLTQLVKETGPDEELMWIVSWGFPVSEIRPAGWVEPPGYWRQGLKLIPVRVKKTDKAGRLQVLERTVAGLTEFLNYLRTSEGDIRSS